MIVCKSCNLEKDINEYYTRLYKTKDSIKISFRRICKKCLSRMSAEKIKEKRKNDPVYKQASILWANNCGEKVISINKIKELLDSPCYFCSSKPVKIVKKRHSLGFSSKNSIPCCERCYHSRIDFFS